MKKRFLGRPTRPVQLSPGISCSELLDRLEGCSFQGRQLAIAAKIWTEALDDDIAVWFGLAGAMVPAGMRKLIVMLMEEGFIDVIVSTGANLYHDYFETAGHYHHIGSAGADDNELRDAKIDRIYDTYADENEFFDLDMKMGKWAGTLEDRPYTTREFLRLLGEEAARDSSGEEGILSAAARLRCRSTVLRSGTLR